MSAQKRLINDSVLNELSAPFSEGDLEWRVQRSGHKNGRPWAIIVPYANSRSIQKRLDETLGPSNWQNTNHPVAKGMLCSLSIKVNGEWVTKTDGAQGESDIDGMDEVKNACSRSLVRSAVLWGIGRYLYSYPVTFAQFVNSHEGSNFIRIDGKEYYWVPPKSQKDQTPEAAPEAALIEFISQRIEDTKRDLSREIPKVISLSPASLDKEIVPFGITQGKALKDLDSAEIYGLIDFYNRVPNPKGKAKSFKSIFLAFVESRTQK